MAIRCKLKFVLLEEKKSQTQLAELTGMSRTTITLIANEKHFPLLESALMIAKALNRNVNEIWYLE